MPQNKKKLRSKADKLWYQLLIKPKCEVCGKQATQVHHFFPKGLFGHLRYNIDNGISLCSSCHFAHHHKGDPRIQQTIIEKRGKKWYNRLNKEKRKSPASYQTISYYRENIEKLQQLLNEK